MNQIEFGKFLSSLRNEQHITQGQLAKKLNVSSKTVSKWECGNCVPDFETLIKISKIFNISLYELSIQKRIKNETIKKENMLKMINKEEFKKISLKRKIFISLKTLLGIILLTFLIYLIVNYKLTHIYDIQSTNKDFIINGTYTKDKDYSVFAITDIKYVGNDKQLLNNHITDYYYEIFNTYYKICEYQDLEQEKTSDKLYLNQVINKIDLIINSKQFPIDDITDENEIVLILNYKKHNMSKYNRIHIQLKLVKKYSNIQIG